MNKLTILVHFKEDVIEGEIRQELKYSVLSTLADVQLNNTSKAEVEKMSDNIYLLYCNTDVPVYKTIIELCSLIEHRLRYICGRKLVSMHLEAFDVMSMAGTHIRREYA